MAAERAGWRGRPTSPKRHEDIGGRSGQCRVGGGRGDSAEPAGGVPGVAHDIAGQVALVGVPVRGGHLGKWPAAEVGGRVLEADDARGGLGSQAELGPEPAGGVPVAPPGRGDLFDPSAHAGDATNPGKVATVYTYTADNLLATEARPHRGDGNRLEVTWTYDGAGRKSTQKMRTVAGFGPGSAAETDPSLRTQVADGGTQRFSYAPADRLTVETGRGGETIQTSYDPDGNPLTIADSTTDATGATSTLTSTFYLDGLLRSTASRPSSTACSQAPLASTGLLRPDPR